MPMKTFNHEDFKLMPWKNGGGTTLELFCLRSPQDEILFRLSSADVKQEGPFSIFPNIERILFLISGNGFKLKFSDFDLTMSTPLTPITFAGEETIHCELIDGACTDFNIMTDRRFGTSELEIKNIKNEEKIVSDTQMLFVYLPREEKLHQLPLHEQYTHDGPKQLAYIVKLSSKHL